MGVPKKKTTQAKRGKRRSHDRATPGVYTKCSHCGELKSPHSVCTHCGYYNDKQVIDKKEI